VSGDHPSPPDPLAPLYGKLPRGWECWRGVGGMLYARRRNSSPPVVLRSDYPQAGMVVVDLDAPVISPSPGITALPIGSSATLPRFEVPRSATPDVVKPPETPVLVGGDVQAAKLITRVLPAYPQTARQLRISGTVHLLGIIAKDGRIQRLQVLNGHPLLRQAAIDAVSQWVYRPTFLNGQPVEVEAPIDVMFVLH